MVATIKFTAAASGVVHDGTSMIVMNKGKVTEAPASAEELLRERKFIKGDVRKSQQADEVGSADLTAALARAEAAEAKVAELEASGPEGKTPDSTFELGDLTLTEKGGGHFEITGPDGFEPVKARGVEQAKAEFLSAVLTAHAAPADEQAPAS